MVRRAEVADYLALCDFCAERGRMLAKVRVHGQQSILVLYDDHAAVPLHLAGVADSAARGCILIPMGTSFTRTCGTC